MGDVSFVNFAILDELVLQYLRDESLFSTNVVEKERCSTKKRTFLQNVMGSILGGDIESAMADLKSSECKDVFKDAELVFSMYKQNFIELLRKGRFEDALNFARTTFCPYALDAYPEAYIEFKETMLLLVFKQESQACPEAWSPEARTKLAKRVKSFVVGRMRLYDADFALMFRYLLLISVDCLGTSSGERLCELRDYVLPDRLPSISEVFCDPGITVQESEVTSLTRLLNIPRFEATSALRFTGRLVDALKYHLMRIELNRPLLLAGLAEYCEFRGLGTQEERSRLAALSLAKDIKANNVLWSLRKLVDRDDVDGLLQETTRLVPGVFDSHAEALFHVERLRFLAALKSRDSDTALNTLRDKLAPIASVNPVLEDYLKTCSWQLLSAPDSVDLGSVRSEVMACLNKILGEALGVREPKLVTVMNYLLDAHSRWYSMQMLVDPFEKEFRLSELALQTRMPAAALEPSTVDPGVDDDKVRSLMDIMAFTRIEAVTLLHEYEGNLENILAAFLP